MDLFKHLLVTSLALLLSLGARAQTADAPPAADSTQAQCIPLREIDEQDLAFHPLEKITMTASYKWGAINTDVGTVSFEVDYQDHEVSPTYHARAVIRTARFFETFFKMRDTYESVFDSRTLRPLSFSCDIQEGKYLAQAHSTFNPDYTIHSHMEKKSATIDTLLQGRECTFDLVTLACYIRNLEFEHMEVGTVLPLSYVNNHDLYDLYLRYEGRCEIEVEDMGTFKAHKVAAQTVAGEVFDGKQELYVWLSDDKNRALLLLESPVVIGKVMVRMTQFDNPKFPLTSKIK